MTERAARRPRRHMTVALVVATTVAIAGYLTGTARTPARHGYHDSRPARTAVTRAPRQGEMATARYAERNAELVAAFALLGAPPAGGPGRAVASAEARARSVADRASRRAFDGAPPVVPHAVDQRGLPACLVCHENGMQVNDRIAPAMSHEPFSSCLQCHAPTWSVPPTTTLAASVAEASRFVGLESAGRGERAEAGAPPQIPHRTFMRERCTSCHDAFATGLAVSHPERSSCTQCHAPSSTLDQMPRSTFAPLGALSGAP